MARGLDYYAVLGLPRNTTTEEVKRAYRSLALKWHPERNKDNEDEAQKKFREIAESYEVLINQQCRAIFDQFGESGLKDGLPDGHGGTKGGLYAFSGDEFAIYENFFGHSSPFADIFGDMEAGGAEEGKSFQKFTGLSQPETSKQSEPVQKDFSCNMQELYNGCTKKINISKKILTEDGLTTKSIDKTLAIEVKRGFTGGSTVVFPKEGDEGQGIIPADLVFTLREQPSHGFERSGNELVYLASITLEEALCGCIVEVTTLDNRTLCIPINDIVSPGYSKTVIGEGMPLLDQSAKFGNLILKFKVIYPDRLTETQKLQLRKILCM